MASPTVESREMPSDPKLVAAEEPAAHGLERGAIGLLQSTVIGVASSAPAQSTAVSIGALILASNYGGPGAILVLALPMLAIAFCFQRLNLWEQNCGASYVWVGRSISPYLGFAVGWLMLAGYLLGTAADVFPIGPSVLALFGANTSSQLGAILSGTILVAGVTAFAVIGVQLTARFQLAIAAVEYAILVVFCVIGLYVEFISHPAGTVHPTLAWLSPTGVGGKGSLVAGALIAVYLFSGWDTSMYLNEETERPERNPGRAVLLAVAILALFYAILMFSLQGAASSAAINAHSSSTLVYIAHQLVGSPWDKFMAFAIVLSVLGTTQAFIVSTARISYSMGSDDVMPQKFGEISRRFRTPVFATVFFGLVTIVVLCLYVLSASLGAAFSSIVNVSGVLFALFYAFTGIATAWFYRRLLARSTKDALLVGVLPLAATAVLFYIAIKSIITFTGTERWTLAAIAISGATMLLVARLVYQSAFFRIRRTAFDPDTAALEP